MPRPKPPASPPPKIRCKGCGGAINLQAVINERFARCPQDALSAHLSVSTSCIDELRELGDVEWLLLPAKPDFKNLAKHNADRSDEGLVLAVRGTIRVIWSHQHGEKLFRIGFIDARRGGDHFGGRFKNFEGAKRGMALARKLGPGEASRLQVKDWWDRGGRESGWRGGK